MGQVTLTDRTNDFSGHRHSLSVLGAPQTKGKLNLRYENKPLSVLQYQINLGAMADLSAETTVRTKMSNIVEDKFVG